MKEIDVKEKSLEIQKIISRYTKESFVCFFADFIRHHPERSNIGFSQKFKSKLKDSQYLIMLRLSSSIEGEEELYYSPKNDTILQKVADLLLEIVSFYLGGYGNFDNSLVIEDERHRKLIHELAFKDYFQNGVLNYREQELNKVIRLFYPFKTKIKERLGIELKTLIDICNFSEKFYQQKAIETKSFILNKDFAKLAKKSVSEQLPQGDFLKELSSLSNNIHDDFLDFFYRPHNCLLYSKSDYQKQFDIKSIDIFCDLFSIDIADSFNYLFYSQENPIDSKPIIKLNDSEYLSVYQKQLPTALYNLLYKVLSSTKKEKERLDRRKGKVILENHTKEVFEKFFNKSKYTRVFTNYYINNHPEEKDILIISDRVAYIIECKSSRNREPRRNLKEAYQRIKSDFNDCIQKGYNQCYQVEKEILNNKEICIKHQNDEDTILTSEIRELFSIVVTSERFASIQSDLGLLLKRNDDEDIYPWSVYIDDLETFLKTLKIKFNNAERRFTEFLEYRELLNERLFARDELDVCALYIKDPIEFRRICKSEEYIITDPHLQGNFDQLYFNKKLKFKILNA